MLFNEIGRYLVYVNFFKSCIQNRKELNILVSIVFSPSLKGILANKTTSIMSFLTNKQWIVSQQLCIYLMLTFDANKSSYLTNESCPPYTPLCIGQASESTSSLTGYEKIV